MAWRSSRMPEFDVYRVSPRLIEATPASRITSGVTKSGSPMPREITSCMVAAMSKNLRMPDVGTAATRLEIRLDMNRNLPIE